MQNNVNFVTDGSKVYRLGGNDWYAVEQDDDKVMLVDTDCKIGDKNLWTWWSDPYSGKEGENGQCVLDYCNNLIDKYFGKVKHVIIPRNVDAGTGELENAYMWPMSRQEFIDNKVIGGKIACNSNGNVCNVWTRTFSGIYGGSDDPCPCAWYVYGGGDLSDSFNVYNMFHVAPAFYLRKSAIDHINDDGEIVLKPEDNID